MAVVTNWTWGRPRYPRATSCPRADPSLLSSLLPSYPPTLPPTFLPSCPPTLSPFPSLPPAVKESGNTINRRGREGGGGRRVIHEFNGDYLLSLGFISVRCSALQYLIFSLLYVKRTRRYEQNLMDTATIVIYTYKRKVEKKSFVPILIASVAS